MPFLCFSILFFSPSFKCSVLFFFFFLCQLAFPVLTCVLKGEVLAMGYDNIDGKSNGCIGIMVSLHKQLHCVIGVVFCGKYNLLISKLGSVKLCDSLSVSCHPFPSAVDFADGFGFFSEVSVGVVLFIFLLQIQPGHLAHCSWVCKRNMLEYHKRESERWKFSRPKCFESSSVDKKRVVSIPSTPGGNALYIVATSVCNIGTWLQCLLGFVITFK